MDLRLRSDHETARCDGTCEREIQVLIPMFDDWIACGMLLRQLDAALVQANLQARVMVVDDGSTLPTPVDFASFECDGISQITLFSLRRNVGHQRAIALGLAYLAETRVNTPVVVMDADGEDAPADIQRLYDAFVENNSAKIIFASRTKRSESLRFRVFYQCYKRLLRALTGRQICFGNFSIVPPAAVQRLAAVSELWNHYAAAVVKSRLPLATIKSARSKRLDGKSQMNFLALVIHGLSAISVFSDVVGVRLLCVSLVLALLSGAGMAVVAVVRLCTNLAVPGWATSASGILALLLMQAVMMSVAFVFIVLSGRTGNQFLPIRDYAPFVNANTTLTLNRRRATPPGVSETVIA